MVINMNKFSGFYKKSTNERIDILKDVSSINDAHLESLDLETADHMIENAVSVFEVPLGIAPGFLIDNKTFNIPMATEESSVVAAASNAAKIVSRNGGFKTSIDKRLMRGEVAFEISNNKDFLIETIKNEFKNLKSIADAAHPSIVKRGGGVSHFELRVLNNFVILDVFMDTQEAMGANMMNTVLESIASYLSVLCHQKPLMAILSNLTTESLVHATCSIDITHLRGGSETATKIASASLLASEDVYRCATHNKGIMNGIDAVVLATGNDMRAVNAGIYTYASLSGQIKPLVTWSLEDDKLIGNITIPLAIGSVGGAISIHPKAKLTKSILQYDNVKELMSIVASVGLAQNFAALYALTTVGIQKGHMGLHAKNIAITAGATQDILEEVTKRLQQEKTINIETAKQIIEDIKRD